MYSGSWVPTYHVPQVHEYLPQAHMKYIVGNMADKSEWDFNNTNFGLI